MSLGANLLSIFVPSYFLTVTYPYFWLFLMAKVLKKSEISKSLLRNAIISHNYKAKKPDFL